MKNETTDSETEESIKKVLGRLEEIQDEVGSGLLPLVRYFRKKGRKVRLWELMFLQLLTAYDGGPSAVPTSVAQFFELLVKSRQCSRVLNPVGGFGLLGAHLAESLPTLHIDVVTSMAEAEEIISDCGLDSLSLHVGSIGEAKGCLAKHYDAIVASDPVDLKRETRTYDINGQGITLDDDPSCLLITDVAENLDPEGFIAVVVSPRFSTETGARSVRKNIACFGLHLSAVLTFPPDVFLETTTSFDLAIITRERHGEIFVAGVPEDHDAQQELVSRLWKRQPGAMADQGRLVSEDRFHGLEALRAEERVAHLGASKGLTPIPFDSAVSEIRFPKRRGTEFDQYDDHPHAVYLPEMANEPATTQREALPEQPKSHLQLIVDPSVVLPEYLAEILNTPLGHAMRQPVNPGAAVPRINETFLRESTLYLAPFADQQRTLEALSSIQKLRNELSELESSLWEHPRQVDRVIESIDKVNHEERFQDWIEVLPFPLASILRSYHAMDRMDKEKYERLLHFFEAFTEFCATVHLSAFRTSTKWDKLRAEIVKVMRNQHFSLERATFGLWRAIVELLAARLRTMLNAKNDDPAAARALYATASTGPLEMLSSKALVGVLQRVNGFRNKWAGHGGAVSLSEAGDRHTRLRDNLEELRGIIGTKFLQYKLVEPRDAEILEGPLFRCRVRYVMGSNPQLEHGTMTVTTPAKTGTLYLYNPGHDKVLELVPFIQVRDTPQPASYFYNHCEKTEMHLVSYHFAQTSEVSSPSAPLTGLLNDLRLRDAAPDEAEL